MKTDNLAWLGEDKTLYRIPSISEFVDGFKYEVYSEGFYEDSVEDFFGWYKYTWPWDGIGRDLKGIEREIKNGMVRVAREN